jgi:hypothetical protein
MPFQVLKADARQQIVYGWGSVAVKDGETVTDLQGDQIDPATLEQAVYDFLLSLQDGENKATGVMHEGGPVGDLVCSIVTVPDVMKALLGTDPPADLPIGWFIGVKVRDPKVWQQVQNGTLKAFSIQGSAERDPVTKAFDEAAVTVRRAA